MANPIMADQPKQNAAATPSNLALKNALNFDCQPIFFLLAAIPLLHALATWDLDGNLTGVNQTLRLYSLPVVCIELIAIWLAARQGWRPAKHYLELPPLVKWLCATFCASVAVTTVFESGSAVISVLFVVRYMLHIFLASSLVFLIAKDRQFNFDRWVSVHLLGMLLYLTSLTAFCLLVTDPANFRWVERLPSATNVRQIGNVLGILSLIPATVFVFSRRTSATALAAAIFIALMIFTMWSGTRGALMGFIAAICIAGWQNREAINPRRLTLLALCCVTALAISILIPTPAPEFGIIRIAESFSGEDSSSGRWEMWQTTLGAIGDAPFLGHGAGTYRENMAVLNGYPYNHPHNFVLQFIYDWGIIGGGLALALVAWVGCSLFASDKGAAQERFMAQCGFVALIAIGLIEGTLFHPLPIVIAVVMASPYVARRKA